MAHHGINADNLEYLKTRIVLFQGNAIFLIDDCHTINDLISK